MHTRKIRACNFRVGVSVDDCTLSFLHNERTVCPPPPHTPRVQVSAYLKLALQDPKFSSNDDDDNGTLYRRNTLIIYVDEAARHLNRENDSTLGMRDPLIPLQKKKKKKTRSRAGSRDQKKTELLHSALF